MQKSAKPIGVLISVLLMVSMLSMFAATTVQAAPVTAALHTEGSSIVDANGNVVYLRGMGLAGVAPNLILWGPNGGDNWGNQWNYNPTTVMDQTFSAMQTQWKINMIRVFIYPSWYYRDNIAPSQEDPSATSTTPISTRAYLQTLLQEADKYGIYVDIVPYMLTPSTSSFSKDPYATTSFGWQGLPMMGWDTAGQNFLNAAGYSGNEKAFWQWFWTDMANTLKAYPNAIFEAWNEPGWNGGDTEPIPQGYMNYLQTMHDAIRSTGATNLIMYQWHMGWAPNGWGATLGWAGTINNAFHPTNTVYTTHFYYYAPADNTALWAKDYATLKTQIKTGIDSMGVTAPLVINEEGSCLTSSPNKQNDYTWWQNIILAQRDLGIGAGAYYWLSDQGLGPVYSGETMLSTGTNYTPNAMGTAYINGAPAQSPIGTTPTPSPTASPTPNPTAIPVPTPSPTPTATPTTVPSPMPIPTASPSPKPTTAPLPTTQPTPSPTDIPAPTDMPVPDPTITPVTPRIQLPPNPTANSNPTPTPTPPPAPMATPNPTVSPTLIPIGKSTWASPWSHFGWNRFNGWFFYFRLPAILLNLF